MAAPLLGGGEVTGVIAFVRSDADSNFGQTTSPKLTILAAQLGSALEALRLNQLAQEEHRRASILVELAAAMHDLPEASTVAEGIADRLRKVLNRRPC